MRGAIAGIDHVVLGVRSLEEAREQWRRLGFAVSPRGWHLGQDTANYCLMFAADYVELLGRAEPTAAATEGGGMFRLAAFLAEREGPIGVAFAPAGNAAGARDRLLRRGLHPSDPHLLARTTEVDGGTVTPHFRLVALPTEETPGLCSFLCEHLTPALVRRPEWLRHPNGALGIAGIHVLVDSTAALPPAYDRLFGIHAVTTTDAVVTVHFGRHRIVFSTPDDFTTMHPELDPVGGLPLPAICVIEIRVAALAETAGFLAARQAAAIRMPDGSLALAAGEANGTILIFSE